MNTDIKTAIDIAAASPDGRVRGIVQRRMEMAKELETKDSFLLAYASETAVLNSGAEPKIKPVKLKNGKTNGSMTPRPDSKNMRMAKAVRDFVVAQNRLVPLEELYAMLQKDHASLCPSSADTLRVRLNERKEAVKRHRGGYWPTGMDLPVTEGAIEQST